MNLDAIAAARSTSMILPKTEDRASSDTLIGLSAERGDKAKREPIETPLAIFRLRE
jgi:hypothetical protein